MTSTRRAHSECLSRVKTRRRDRQIGRSGVDATPNFDPTRFHLRRAASKDDLTTARGGSSPGSGRSAASRADGSIMMTKRKSEYSVSGKKPRRERAIRTPKDMVARTTNRPAHHESAMVHAQRPTPNCAEHSMSAPRSRTIGDMNPTERYPGRTRKARCANSKPTGMTEVFSVVASDADRSTPPRCKPHTTGYDGHVRFASVTHLFEPPVDEPMTDYRSVVRQWRRIVSDASQCYVQPLRFSPFTAGCTVNFHH